MRFTTAIISALALASIGVQSAPAPQDDVSAETFGKPTPPPQECKWVCEPPKNPPTPPKCVDYCVFKDWDLSQNIGGPTQPKDVKECAKDSAGWNPKSDAAVFHDKFCYIKNTKDVTSQNFYRSYGRFLIIQGKCNDLKKDYKYKPDMFWGSWDDNTCKK